MTPTKLSPPIKQGLPLTYLHQLVSCHAPYQLNDESHDQFYQAMGEICRWHYHNSPYYKALCQQQNYTLKPIKNTRDLAEIPYVLAHVLKRHKILSVDEDDIDMHLTSSGTTGQKTQIFFDHWSLASAQKMLDDIVQHYGWDDQSREVDYLLLSYEPSPGFSLGTSYTDNFLCKYAPTRQVHYALKNTGEGHQFDLFGCIRAISHAAQEQIPLRIFGFPSFLYFTIEKMLSMGLNYQLHPDSFIFFGGGWKGHQNKAIDKSEFYPLIHRVLGIPDERIRDGFGSVEHCIPYVECAHHQFHLPIYSRVLIRNTQTFEPLEYGKVGLLNFISPYITSVPAHSVVMGDLASLHPASDCGCGLDTEFFRVHGRAGTSKSMSCALSANAFLQEQDNV